jgi:isopentenyl diphosphate isomerase/L-lactate dehydrogenase-like FMN-dependent dehydrogenase
MSVPGTSFADYQFQIYAAGLQGERPALPMSLAALEDAARAKLASGPFSYVAGGAGLETTMTANRKAFDRWRIVPRMLRGVGTRDLSRTVLGTPLPAPVILAPVGVQSVVHPEAEGAVAQGAKAVGVPMILSTVSSVPMERVAAILGDQPRWFQLYYPKDRELAVSLVSRAEKAGFGAVVITLDTTLLGWREKDLQEAYLPFLKAEGLANYFADPVFRASLEEPPEENPQAAIQRWVQIFANPDLAWEDIAYLRERTRLPIVLKGILHPDDARRAREEGMAGMVVSNHGGRQLDGAIGALEALPGVVEAVGEECAVLFDSGIRSGADAFKALALGAQAVLLGRPYVWGLAVAGAAGVEHVLRNFLADLDLTLALSGSTSFDGVTRECLQQG